MFLNLTKRKFLKKNIKSFMNEIDKIYYVYNDQCAYNIDKNQWLLFLIYITNNKNENFFKNLSDLRNFNSIADKYYLKNSNIKSFNLNEQDIKLIKQAVMHNDIKYKCCYNLCVTYSKYFIQYFE